MAGITPFYGLLFVMMEIVGAVLAVFVWRNLGFACFGYKCEASKD